MLALRANIANKKKGNVPHCRRPLRRLRKSSNLIGIILLVLTKNLIEVFLICGKGGEPAMVAARERDKLGRSRNRRA
jgi:hypothetical protein